MDRKRFMLLLVVVLAALMVPALVSADALDDLGTKLGTFINRAGLIAAGLILPTGSLAVGTLAVRRSIAKGMGDEEVMMRSGSQIGEIVKWTAIGTGASLLTAVAGTILA